MAMFRRPRPGGGRHPPPLAPTVSNFKPRAQWNNSGSSIFLYVNLPGFYMDQIEIKKDEKARTIQIQGQRPLSAQTKAHFNEAYRVPDSCDMSKSNTSFSHGLLTIEFQALVKPEKAIIQDQGKTVQRPLNQEERRGASVNGSSLGRKKSLDENSQKKAAPLANEEEPRTYKSVVEGKKTVQTGSNREKSEQKVKEEEASPSLGRKEHVKEEKVVERKEASQKLKEKKATTSTATVASSLKPKVHVKEDKVTERKKEADKTEQKVKEEGFTRTPTIDGSLEPNKVHEIGQKLKEEGKISLGQKKEEKHIKAVVADEVRRTDKETAAMNQTKPELKKKERAAIIAHDDNGNVKSKKDDNNEKMVGDKVSEGEIKETVKQKKVEETGLVKETVDLKDNLEVAEPRKVDLGDSIKEESTKGGEDGEKIVKKSSESQTGPLLVEDGPKHTNMDPSAVGGREMDEEEQHKYDISLVNVGVAALVIMVFGAYVFVPLVKLFY